jgi:hypothetical protein
MISTRKRTDAVQVQAEEPKDRPHVKEEVEQGRREVSEALASGNPTGEVIMDEAVKEPTLDRFLDGNPKVINSDDDYVQLAEILRKKRAMDIKAEAKKKAKKDGVEDDD